MRFGRVRHGRLWHLKKKHLEGHTWSVWHLLGVLVFGSSDFRGLAGADERRKADHLVRIHDEIKWLNDNDILDLFKEALQVPAMTQLRNFERRAAR